MYIIDPITEELIKVGAMKKPNEKMNRLYRLMNWAQKRVEASSMEFLPTSDLDTPKQGNHIVVGKYGICGIQKFENNRPGAILYGMDFETALKYNANN